MKDSEFFKLIGYVLITFIVVWFLALVSNKCFGIEINSDTAIISFIGIIATFIVVGNFSQVAEMKNQAMQQTENYNKKIEEFNAKLREIDSLNEKLEAKEKDINDLQIEFYESQIENYILLSLQFSGSNNTAFILLKSAFLLLPKTTKGNNEILISKFTSSIKDANEKFYTKISSEEISNTISKLRSDNKTDEKLLNELQEEIDKKNIEFGF